MTCRDAVDMIADAFEGATPAESRRRFEDHLGACGRCRRYLRGYAKAVELVRGAFEEDGAPGAEPVPEELVQELLRAIDEEPDSESDVS